MGFNSGLKGLMKDAKMCMMIRGALHRRRHHYSMKGYKNWCNAMISVSTMMEIMSKSSVRYVYQMAIYVVCDIFLFFS